MTTITASVVTAFNVDGQNFYDIEFTGVNLYQNHIANVSKANIAVVTSSATLPGDFVDGAPILITGVQGMTQLPTHGKNGTNLYYANVLSSNTFSLYTDSSLSTGANSAAFSNAVSNTGVFNTFTGAEYVSKGTSVPLVFPTIETNVGTDISIDTVTGEISLAADITYQIIVQTQPLPNPASQGGYFVLYDEGAGSTIGQSTPFGETFVATVTPSSNSVFQVYAVAPGNGNWEDTATTPWVPPAGVQYSSISIQAVSGYTVA